jgi:hypothetical protein
MALLPLNPDLTHLISGVFQFHSVDHFQVGISLQFPVTDLGGIPRSSLILGSIIGRFYPGVFGV